jgi:hypothetical protein
MHHYFNKGALSIKAWSIKAGSRAPCTTAALFSKGSLLELKEQPLSGDINPCVRAVRARSLSASSFLLLFLSPFLSLPRILFLSPSIVEFLSVALVRGLPPPALFTPPPPALLPQES